MIRRIIQLVEITMSTPAESGAVEGKNVDRRMSLGKYVKRMSSVFKREKSGKGSSLIAPGAPSVPEIEQEAAKMEVTEGEAAPAA